METFQNCRGLIYTVEKGDTLYRIGQKYQVKVSALIFANPYVDVYNLQPGDQICIPMVRERFWPPLS